MTNAIDLNAIKSRDLTLQEIGSAAWAIMQSKYEPLMYSALAVLVPVSLLKAIVPHVPSSESMLGVLVWVVGTVFFNIFFSLAGIIPAIAVMIIVDKHLKGDDIDFREALKLSWEKFVDAAIVFVISSVIVGLLMLIIVPGIIFGVYYAFVVYAVVFQNKKTMEALRYSKELVSGQWWRVFLFLLVLMLAIYVVVFAIMIPLGMIAFIVPIGFVNNYFFELGYSLVTTVFMALPTTIFYLNLEHRKFSS